MNKAFTLVELLAVIAILAIILFIAVPYFMNAVNNSKYSALAKDEVMMANTAERYMIKNISKLPSSIGGTTQVTLSTLVSENYMNNIISPFDKSVTCDGYVLITRLTGGDYDYTPYLNCDSALGNYIDDGLIANIKSDGTALNFTPNTIAGAIYGATATINRFGDSNKAMLLDGTDDYIDLGNQTDLVLNTGGTISTWIYLNSWNGTNYSTTVICRSNGASWNSLYYDIFKLAGVNYLILTISDGTNSLQGNGPKTGVLSLNTWYNITATWDSTTKCMYVNGTQSQCVSSTVMPSTNTTATSVSVGKSGPSNTYYFNGNVDDIKIYNRALTATEIKTNYSLDKLRSY